MLKHYFKIALRNLRRQKVLAFINIIGLSLGLACFSLFLLYAVNEFNFDNFHKNGGNIYHVYKWTEGINDDPFGGVPYQPMPLGPAMKQELPGIENYARFLESWGESFIKTDKGVIREKISFADPSFFTMFSFKLKYGSAATALQDLHSIVLTEKAAEKMFGKTEVLGKTIEIKSDDNFESFIVTAVAEDIPSNSTFQFNILANFQYHATTKHGLPAVNNWNRISYKTFVQLKPGNSLPDNKKLLADFRNKYYPDEESEARKNGWKGEGSPSGYGLQPLQEMHTDTKIDRHGAVDPKTIWILLGIATGILLIACINFTTLAIGRSAGRSKEVGVRKMIGSSRKSLILQFLTDALLLVFISAIVSLLLVKILLPYFNQLSGKELNFSFTQFPQLLWLIISLVLIVGLLAGSYPALVLSGFKPVEVLKTKVKLGGSNIFTRSLMTIQFVLSTGLIISTIIIMQQLHYMQSKNPGFNKENVVVVDADGISDTKKSYALLKNELSAHPEITDIASAELSLGEGKGSNQSGFKYQGKTKEVYEYFVDPDYIRVLGLKLLAGRNFDPAIASDTVTSVVINESMMNDFGWTLQNAVGQKLKGYYENESDVRTPVVIGVVRNFNYFAFSSGIEPQMFQQFSFYQPRHFFVRIRPGNPSASLKILQSSWKKISPDYPLQYSFLDEDLNRFYESEARWSRIIGWAGGISIFLACLGLLGLAALSAINRTKEIGIRKVLGASLAAVVSLLSKDFLKLVLIAFIIAAPLAWYIMNKWLQSYAYRINISWWVFALAGVGALLIALITVSFQAIRAAMANPVKSLRTE